MKIVHCCNRYYPYFGGLETHVQNVSERMAKMGHDVLVYTTDPSGKLPRFESINGVGVFRFKVIHPFDVYFFSTELFAASQAVTCDIMHGHDLHGFPLFAVTQSKKNVRRIATLHVGGSSSYFRNLLRLPYDRLFMHHFLKRVEKIICVSESELQQYSHILNLPINKFALIPNGANFSFSDTETHRKNFRYILSVGRLEKSKGFQHLLKSFSLICREEEFEDVKLVIVGNGPYKNNLIKLITELKVNQKVRMLENVSQDELKMLYQDCVAFVLLSEYESQSIVTIDALSLHKPVISTKQGALGEYVRKGYSIGVDWPPNPSIVAFEMTSVLRNPEKFPPMGFMAHTWDNVALELISLYQRVLS